MISALHTHNAEPLPVTKHETKSEFMTYIVSPIVPSDTFSIQACMLKANMLESISIFFRCNFFMSLSLTLYSTILFWCAVVLHKCNQLIGTLIYHIPQPKRSLMPLKSFINKTASSQSSPLWCIWLCLVVYIDIYTTSKWTKALMRVWTVSNFCWAMSHVF